MAKKIRHLWQKVLTFVLGLFGVAGLTSCDGEGPFYGMYGMVDMYGMPDPIDLPVMYGPAPIREGIHGRVVSGSAEEEGSIEITPLEEDESGDEISAENGIEGIEIYLYDANNREFIDKYETFEGGEFFLSADEYLNKDVIITFSDKDPEENGSYRRLQEVFTLKSTNTFIKVVLQPGKDEE